MTYRTEHDSMGEVRVPADRYWGAQTERSRNNFPIGAGHENMPGEIIRAFAVLKMAAALANRELKPEKMTAKSAARSARRRRKSLPESWMDISRWWSGRRDPAPRAI